VTWQVAVIRLSIGRRAGNWERRGTAWSLADQIRAELSGADAIDEAASGAGLERLKPFDPRLFEQTWRG
jgi:hypothetical protein